MKLALIVLCDTESLESLGKVSNALYMAAEALENGDIAKVIFSGAGTKWIHELEQEKHPMHALYMEVKSSITACEYCSKGFKQTLNLQKAGVPLVSEFRGHASIRKLVDDGYTILTI